MTNQKFGDDDDHDQMVKERKEKEDRWRLTFHSTWLGDGNGRTIATIMPTMQMQMQMSMMHVQRHFLRDHLR